MEEPNKDIYFERNDKDTWAMARLQHPLGNRIRQE